ncbi:uncharacterized protein Pyn_26219 [Prunus yedoensis var. nudiflora]|uniref:Uncharacterized protein n=1 Tax=Prunus yedoensis var. nudiflora TaxID=2094558 RepID=A0A314ZJY5_PRUYE|nr:uncharacterized protein Pyn_26219 [Prunus yedoensis var. nudiflora]
MASFSLSEAQTTKQQMYPKVKVRLQEQDDYFFPQNHHRTLLLTNASDESVPGKEIRSCSPPSTAITKKAYVSKLPGHSISSSKEENSRNPGKATKPADARACSILRPRAVLSSPENDGMIGSRNKLVDKKSSNMKVHNTKEKVAAAQKPQQPKIVQSQVKKAARPMSMTKRLQQSVDKKNGVVQSGIQKPMMEKQQASLGMRKPSFTST